MTGFDERSKGKASVLIGKRVYLRPLMKEDLVYLRKWSQDAEIRGLIGETAPMSQVECEKFLEKVYADSSREWFMVVAKPDNRVIGEAGLLRMDHAWHITDISVILWEKEEWGKGYGSEAILLLLDYAFGHLNFHRVAMSVISFNERALRFWEKIGFKREGVERDGYYYDGKYYDFVNMSILEDEFRQLHGGEAVRCQTRAVREEGGEE